MNNLNIDIDKLIDGYYESDIHQYYKKHGESKATHFANLKKWAKTGGFRKQMKLDSYSKERVEKTKKTLKERGFNYREASLKGAEKMKNMSPEMRQEYGDRASKIHKGKKRSDQVKRNISDATKGRPSPNKGKKFSEESRKKMSQSAKGKVISEQQKQKTREWMLENNPFKGKKHTQETLQIIKDKHPSKIKVNCEHCKKLLDLPNYKRYHGEKCKLFNPDGHVEKFLLLDRSIKIIDLLDKKKTYKEITQLTGYCKNTIIKTNRLYNQTIKTV